MSFKGIKEAIITERLEFFQGVRSAKIIDRLSHDLKAAFPDMNGFSPRNLIYMRKFAQEWPNKEIVVQRTVAQIPWRSNLTLIEKMRFVP